VPVDTAVAVVDTVLYPVREGVWLAVPWAVEVDWAVPVETAVAVVETVLEPVREGVWLTETEGVVLAVGEPATVGEPVAPFVVVMEGVMEAVTEGVVLTVGEPGTVAEFVIPGVDDPIGVKLAAGGMDATGVTGAKFLAQPTDKEEMRTGKKRTDTARARRFIRSPSR